MVCCSTIARQNNCTPGVASEGENADGLKGVPLVDGTAGEAPAEVGVGTGDAREAGDEVEEELGPGVGAAEGAPGHCRDVLPAHVRVHWLL